MVTLLIDVDNVIRALDVSVWGKYNEVWVKDVDGVPFREFIEKDLEKYLVNAPETEYCQTLKDWDALVGISNVTFLTSQPVTWRPYTERWIKARFPNAKIVFTDTPEDKIEILNMLRLAGAPATLIEDYPKFKSYQGITLIDRAYNREIKADTRIKDPFQLLQVLIQAYVYGIRNAAKLCHAIAKKKGWWDDKRSEGEAIALMHSELSEALEAMRAKERSENAIIEELVDTCVRVFDYCDGKYPDRFENGFIAKLAINLDRPYRHDKRF